jgi:hypothetical protein
MKTKSLYSFAMVIFTVLTLAFIIPSCSDDSDETTTGEDLTVTIVGSYLFELRENSNITASNVATQISKVNNNTIQIAISGNETVQATVVKPETGTYFLINVLDQAGITEGTGGDFVNNEINIGFKKSGVQKNYYGIKQ